jgi:translocation and assembly module TamA
LDYGVTDETSPVTLLPLGQNLVTAALLGAFNLDRSNDPLDPKQGWRMEARVEPTVITGDSTLEYVRVQAQATAYLPFDSAGRTVLAGRVKAGSIFGGSIPDVPASHRFYSGGGGSVRGYAYQAIGPHLADNTPEGGLSLLEGSLELRRKLAEHWGIVAFVDAGSIGSSQIPNGANMDLGAGIGVRYDLGFGPFRADLAFPLHPRSNDAGYQIYLSIGQSF